MINLYSKISVIIVNWNGEKFLDQCLNSLAAQSILPNEVLLLDNNSEDASLNVISKFPFVNLIKSQENTGFARGNNLLIELSSSESEWIVLLNPDAFVDYHWLESLLMSAISNPDYDVFASKLLMDADPTRLDGAGDSYHISGLVWRAGHGVNVSNDTDCEREIFSPCAAAAMYRRSLLCSLGGFDEDYFCYVEDVDLGFRIRLAGCRCLYVPNSIVRHVGSGTTGGQDSDFAVFHGHRNLVWTFIKNMPGILFWIFLPFHLLMNLLVIISFSLRGRGWLILRSKGSALLAVPKMWRKRQIIQSNRVASINDIWRILDKSLVLTKIIRRKI
jgi:GT2 family glycosyltransferase